MKAVETEDYQGPERRKGSRRERWALRGAVFVLVGVAAILVLTAVGYKQDVDQRHSQDVAQRQTLRRAAIDGCRRNNVVRMVATLAVDKIIHSQIDSLRTQLERSDAIPPRFFPSIPPAKFRQLQAQAANDSHHTIHSLQRVNKLVKVSLHQVHCYKKVVRVRSSST